jgi:hypothetical protein
MATGRGETRRDFLALTASALPALSRDGIVAVLDTMDRAGRSGIHRRVDLSPVP